MNKFVLIALLSLFACAMAENYAVLVAGSKGYGNYRHQSDVCHAYHTLLAKGYKASNIIVFSFNDVAKSNQNPFRGQLFNKPTYQNPGVNVNQGCVIDYEGIHVTPANYLAVIKGLQNQVSGGSRRVLMSGPNDHVFLSFFDHGAPGLIAFPKKYLYANDLLNAFTYMYNNKMYSRLVYYLEACESGSMFINLTSNLNVYALSAANPNESSWAAYCGSDAVVGGKNIGSCLGDLFSVNWMENTDNQTNLTDFSIEQQFEIVAQLTTQSQVMQWGDLDFTSESVGDYLSGTTDNTNLTERIATSLRSLFNFKRSATPMKDQPKTGLLDSRKVPLAFLTDQYTQNPTQENYDALQAYVFEHEKFEKLFTDFAHLFKLKGASNALPTNFECYSTIIDNLELSCGQIPESQMGGLKYLYEICGQNRLDFLDYGAYFSSIC